MMNRMALSFLGIALFGILSIAAAQDRPWAVVTSTNVTESCILDSIAGGMLLFHHAYLPDSVAVDSIQSLRIYRESSFWEGAGWGTLAGAVAGAAVVAATTHEEAQDGSQRLGEIAEGARAYGMGIGIGAAMGFVIGGAIGSSAGVDQTFEMSRLSHQRRIQFARSLIQTYGH